MRMCCLFLIKDRFLHFALDLESLAGFLRGHVTLPTHLRANFNARQASLKQRRQRLIQIKTCTNSGVGSERDHHTGLGLVATSDLNSWSHLLFIKSTKCSKSLSFSISILNLL